MLNKFILVNKDTNDSKVFKTIKEISNELHIDYFQARSIYLESKKPKKFLHNITQQLCDKYAIYDNPDMFNALH